MSPPLRSAARNAGLILCLLALLALLPAGCARREPSCCPCPAQGRLSQELMLRLATVRSLHHQADLQLAAGDQAAARQTLRKILALDLNSRWPEAEEARLDAAARLATLLLEAGQPAQALQLLDQELQGTVRESFYLSNLHSVRGEVLERQVKALDSAGQKDQARALAQQAMAAFETSIAINQRLQAKLEPGGAQAAKEVKP